MLTSERLFVVIFWCVLILSAKTGAHVTKGSCPPQAVLDLSSSMPDSSGSLIKSGVVYPPNSTWSKNGKTFGCPCHSKTCLQLCCPIGQAANGRGCVEDDYTHMISRRGYEGYGIGTHLFTHDPCELSSTDRVLLDLSFKLMRDGSMRLKESKRRVQLGKYCVLRITNSGTYWAGGCIDMSWTRLMIWFVVCMCVSVIFAMATFVVYAARLKLKNLKGFVLGCYLASYVGWIFVSAIGLLSQTKLKLPFYFKIKLNIDSGICFFGFASMLWLNVMCIDIWRDFRKVRGNRVSEMKDRQRANFICYTIYAWGCSALYALIFTLSRLVWVWYGSDYNLDGFLVYFVVLPIFGIAVCNACLCISTALRIKQRKKEAKDMADGLNERDTENEKWFYSYVKLLTTVGVLLILFTVAFYWPNEKYMAFVCTFQALQGISTFLIFVWNDDFKQSFRNRFDGILTTMVSFFRRG